MQGLQQLQSQLNGIKAPTITPNFQTGNATSFMSGLKGQFAGEKGNFAAIGQALGQNLTMGMTSQFGSAGIMASSFASALGPIGIAAGVAGAALIGLGAASTQAASAWEDMKTSIGRTTGLKGDNLEDLMSQLQDLRQEFGITAQAASSMVEQAGSIGVGQSKLASGNMVGYKQEILDFTRAITQIQGAWGMSAEATSSGIGKMGSVTLGAWNTQRKARGEEEMSWAEYAYKVGGTTDNLANAMGSSEEEIVTAMRNSSGAIAKWAPDEATYGKWQAMASFLIDTGDSAGEAGTKIERVSQKMEQNSADVAALMGLDEAGMQSKLKTDFMGTVQELGKSIASMPASQRPDLFKMFGIEGASLIGKVVADIEAGTGKLQSAFDLALSPGNVEAGYQDVADNASKAFDRIGQAAQVSLEKIGGQLLPFVTSFANSIADAWVSANEAGSQLFAGAQKLLSGNAGLGVDVSESGLLGQLGYGGEWEIGWDGIHRKAADAIGEGAKEGTQTGMEAGSNAAQKQVAEDLKTAAEEAAKAFAEANDAYIKAHPGGMSLSGTYDTGKKDAAGKTIYASGATRIIGGADHTSTYLKPGTTSDFATMLASYSAQHFSGESISSSGFWNIFDGSGKVVAEKVLDLDAWKEQMRPIVLDLPKYFETAGDSIKGTLRNAIEDGVIEPLNEKPALEGLIKQLNEMEKQHPIEFEAANLGEIRKDIEDSLKGVKIDLDFSGTEADFEVWLLDNKERFETQWANTKQMPLREEQRARWQWEQTATEEQKKYLRGLDAAATSDDPGTASTAAVFLDALLRSEPALARETWLREEAASAQVELNQHVKLVDGTFIAIDENGKALAPTFVDTTAAARGVGTGLLDLVAALANAASQIRSLNWGSGNPTYSGVGNYSPSYIYSGRGLGTTYYSGSNINAPVNLLASHYVNPNNFNGLLNTFANGGEVNDAVFALIGEAGPELVLPLSDPRRTMELLQKYLPIRAFAAGGGGGLRMSSSLSSWGGRPGASSSYTTEGRDPSAAQWQDCVAGGCRLQTETTRQNVDDWNAGVDRSVTDVRDSFSSISDLWWNPETDNRWTISGGADSFQSSSKRGQASVMISDEALKNIKFNPLGDESSWDHYKMDDRIAAYVAQSNAARGISSVMPSGPHEEPAWFMQALESVAGQGKFSSSSKGLLNPAKVEYDTLDLVNSGKSQGLKVSDVWNSIYGEAFTEGCIATNKPDPSLVYTPSAKAISDAAYKQANDDASAWRYLYGESFTEGCIATVKPDSTLKYTASEKIKEEAARALGGSWGSAIVGSPGTITSTLAGIKENTANMAGRLSELKTTIGTSTLASGGILSNGGIFSQLSGNKTFSATGGGALVSGLSKEGYVISYDPRTDTCEGLSFNPPDPSLKTTDRFYLGITAGNLPMQSYEQGYGWGGKVGWTDDPGLQREQAAALSALQEQQQQSTKGIQSISTNGRDLLSVSRQILASSQDANAIAMANAVISAYGGGSSGYGALVSSSGGSDWFSARQSRYGSTFDDWISGGAAGVGQGSDPAWFTAALQQALASGGTIGSMNSGWNNPYTRGQNIVNQVESTGGSYGEWVPSLATEAFVPSSTLAVVGDKPGGEYVVGAARFDSVVEKLGQFGGGAPNITINSPVTVHGSVSGDDFYAVLDERDRKLKADITEQIAVGRAGY